MPRDVLVCGAGIGGLAAGLALARRRIRVRILERAERLEEVGAGLQLSPNAVRVLRALGLEDEVRSTAFEPEDAVVRDGRTGRVQLRVPLKGACERRHGAPYLQTHRADLHAVLRRACEAAGVEIALGRDVLRYETGPRAALLTARERFEADAVIGADGLRSAIRAQMTRGPAPRFTGQVAWRAVVPAHALAAGTIPPDATSWTGPGRHLVTYYLRGGAFINVVAVEERAGFAAEDWRQAGDPAALKAAFAGWDPRLLALLDAVETPFLWGLFDHPPLASWTDGAVALLGDAAHPMLPFLAQGAAMALEDAWVLAAMLSGADDVPSALRRYGAIRRPRTTRVQRMSAANRAIFHAGKGPAHLPARLARGAARLAPGLAGRRLAAVYGHDVTD